MSDQEAVTGMVDEDSLQSYIDQQDDTPQDAGDDSTAGIIDIDVSNAQDPFEPAAHGNYRLRIDKYQPTQAKSSGSPMIKPELTIVRAHDPANEAHVGKKVFENWVIQGDGERFGKWRHRQVTLALGLPATGGPVSAYIGKEFDAELVIEPGDAENRPKNRINNVFTAN